VVEDTIGLKTGRTIESVGMLLDPMTRSYVLGMRHLFLGFWNSSSFIPMDFSILQERGKYKKKPFGLRAKDIAGHLVVVGPHKPPVQARMPKLDKDKNFGVITMLKRRQERNPSR
jgi:hypothetical protein